jgi:transglutaminase-like putative cysteine protease
MRTKPSITLLLLLAVCQLAVSILSPHPARAADKLDPQRSFELTYTVKLTNLPTDGSSVMAWIPIPQTNDWQVIHGYRVDADVPATLVREDRFGNMFLQLDATKAAAAGAVDIPVHFWVTRYKREPLKSKAKYSIDHSELSRWLQPDAKVPVTGKVADEAQAAAGSESERLQAARKLYDHVVGTVKYDKPTDKTGWGQGDAAWVCDNRYGNCTDFHSMFIGEARSLDIPARFRMGIPLPLDKTDGEIGGYHCWAEFYTPEHGWIPVDASEAQKNNARIDELFGSLDASRVDFTLGRDYNVPGTHHAPFNFLIYPYVEVKGQEWKDGVGRAFSFKDM